MWKKILSALLLIIIIWLGGRYIYRKICKQYSLDYNIVYGLITNNEIVNSSKYQDSIEKIYLLNLDKDTEKLTRMENLLNSLNLKYEKYSAIYGKNLKPSNINDSTLTKPIYVKYIDENKFIEYPTECPRVDFRNFSYKARAMGELGCSCSHRGIWRDIINKGYNKVMIFEDDIVFHIFFKQLFELSLSNIPADADIIFLGLFYNKFSLDESTKNKYYVKILKDVASTEAYIVTANGAKKLLENTQQYKMPIDIEISELIKKGIIKAYATYPLLIKQNPQIKSSIG